MTTDSQIDNLQEQLSSLFGSYKAEWLKERIYELFTEPSYFPALTTTRSCVLIGGRGTGKTTVLRGLSYQGQLALSKLTAASIPTWSHYGLYHRINTNHVTAFVGSELTDRQWTALFGHYFNVLICGLVLDFLEWYEIHTQSIIELDPKACARISTSLHLPVAHTHREIREALVDARIQFEAYINNVVDGPWPHISLQAAPIDLLCSSVLQRPQFAGKQFFFLLDEYENLLDYQQQVVNTLIKHASELYSFKIGVRELGWRCRSTLNDNEQLVHPADYARINIAEKMKGATFDGFALKVCTERISRLKIPDREVISRLDVALPGLTEEEEAIKLGVEEAVVPLRATLARHLTGERRELIATMPSLELYCLSFWADSQQMPVETVIDEILENRSEWATRYGNYKYAVLFPIRRGKPGIRKYYAGWSVFTQLAAGNIRYVLELVDQSFLAHLEENGSLDKPISHELQTKAAQRVGGMNLSELEGLSVDGAQLTKLLLSLGRIFQVMASNPEGHAPEVNQFHVASADSTSADATTIEDVERVLNAAVMHLALLRRPGNKLGDVGDTKDYDYMVHPIYSPFFGFSFRRKRKLMLSAATILALIRQPKRAIREVLKANNRKAPDDLPEQLRLFEQFYDAET